LIPVSLIPPSCSGAPPLFSAVTITIPEGYAVTEREIRSALPDDLVSPGKTKDFLEITVYEYSSGKEKLICDKNGEIREEQEEGYIKLLVKIRRDGTIKRFVLVEAKGSGNAAMMEELKTRIRDEFKGR
jgi:hypothetical protein